MFGSSASHGIHIQFMTQAHALDNWKRIGLLQEARTRFATLYCAMHCLLRQKRALYGTVHGPAFQSFAHDARVALAMKDIENSQFWRAIHRLLRAAFPTRHALKYYDANIPSIDKINYLMKKVDNAFLSSQTILNDEDLFGFMSRLLCDRINKEMSEEYFSDDESR